MELDLEVMSFVANLRPLAAEVGIPAEPRFWPEQIRAAWSRLVVSLEDELGDPPGDYPRPLLVRSRVALDTELDRTVERFGAAPEAIAEGYARVSKLFDLHLRAPESPAADLPDPELALVWPLAEHANALTSGFGPRPNPMDDEGGTQLHTGIDLGASVGDRVLSTGPGRVAWVGWMDGTGNTVIIHHGGGWASLYAHLHEPLVAAGARVAAGTPVGLVGRTGRTTGPHLHFELRRRGVPVDPLLHLPAEVK